MLPVPLLACAGLWAAVRLLLHLLLHRAGHVDPDPWWRVTWRLPIGSGG